MFSFWKRQKKEQYFLAVDLGTENIKAAVVRVLGGKATILGFAKVRQALSDMRAGEILDPVSVRENCFRAIEKAVRMAKISPDQLCIGISSEKIKGYVEKVHIQRTSPRTKIENQELVRLIKKVQWKTCDKVRAQISAELGKSEIDVKVVNSSIVEARIDGSRVSNVIGFSGRDLEIFLYDSFAPAYFLSAVQDIADDLHLDLLCVSPLPFSIARSRIVEESNDFSGIFIDVGAELTHYAIVESGAVRATGAFALGGRAFTKRLADYFSLSFAQAEELKLNYSKAQLPKEKSQMIGKLFVEDVSVWLTLLAMVLAENKSQILLPGNIYLCGGGSLLPEIKAGLSSNSWRNELNFLRGPKLKYLLPREFGEVKDSTGLVNDQTAVGLVALAGLGIIYTGSESLMDRVLRKASQTLRI